MARPKIGLHCGQGSAKNGVTERYITPLNAAGIPVFIKSTNDVGFAIQVIESGRRYGLTNTAVLRFVGGFPDNPDYTGVPEDQMEAYYHAYLRPRLLADPGLLAYKNDIWVEFINEPDKNRWDIVCRWARKGIELLNADGWRAVAIGANAGEPERADWRRPEAQALLRHLETRNDRAAISLHESFAHYDIHNTNAKDIHPFLIGRAAWLNEECASMSIGLPTLFISELAWAYDNIPEQAKAMNDVRFYGDTYNKLENVRGAFLWNLSDGWGQAGSKLNAMLEPLAEYAKTQLPDITPPPPPPQCPQLPYTVVYNLYPPDVTREEYQQVADSAFASKQSMTGSADDAANMVSRGKPPSTVQAIATSGTRVIVWEKNRWKDDISAWLFARGVPQIEHRSFKTTPPPPTAFRWEYPVRAPASETSTDPWPGKWFVTVGYNVFYTNSASGKQAYHPGVDLNKEPEDLGLEFFSPADGVVTFSRLLPIWGKVVVIRHDDPNIGAVWTRYAHMQDVYVGEGSAVKAGQAVGTVGTGEGAFGAHLHHDVSRSGILAANPGHWPGTNQQSVLENYDNPAKFYQSVGAVVVPLPDTPPPPPTGGGYTGTKVTYRSYIHGPGDDFTWSVRGFADMMGKLKMPVKYLSHGVNADFAVPNPDPEHHMVRLFWKPDKYKTPEQAWLEDIRDGALKFYGKGYRRFEVHNEPNLPQEGMGLVWKNGDELGAWLVGLCNVARQHMPAASFWFPGFSPGVPWTNQFAISKPAWERSRVSFAGACLHAYTDITNDVSAAANDVVNQVLEAQKFMWLDTPLMVTECSVNRAASPEYKAQVYMEIDRRLRGKPGIKGVCWFISHWSGNPQDQENWFGTSLPSSYTPS